MEMIMYNILPRYVGGEYSGVETIAHKTSRYKHIQGDSSITTSSIFIFNNEFIKILNF